MHLIHNQYLRYYTTNKYDIGMHDLKAIYEKVKSTIVLVAKQYFEYGENHRVYPNLPKMSDLEIISLAITAESLQIDSENLLWAKLQKDYSDLFPNLIHRTRFNARRKSLSTLLHFCLDSLADYLDDKVPSTTLIIDSVPIPICAIVREKSSRVCRDEMRDEICASKAYNPIFRNYYIGYKMHLICSEYGIYRDCMITPANTHDNYYLKVLTEHDEHLYGHNLLGDRAYVGHDIQLQLFENLRLNLDIPFRKNQKDYRKYPLVKKIKRKTIEVVFAQYCDEFNLRKNYAKRFNGFEVRIKTKIAAKTFKQFWNLKNDRPINKTKHALAA